MLSVPSPILLMVPLHMHNCVCNVCMYVLIMRVCVCAWMPYQYSIVNVISFQRAQNFSFANVELMLIDQLCMNFFGAPVTL